MCACACVTWVRASWYTATIAFCYWECSRPAYKPGRTDSEARRKANTPSLNRFKTFWFAVYLAAWALLIFLLLLEDVVKADEAAFNPFEILGVEVRRSLSPVSSLCCSSLSSLASHLSAGDGDAYGPVFHVAHTGCSFRNACSIGRSRGRSNQKSIP